MYDETTVHIENSNVEVNDNYMMHIDRQAIYDSVSTLPLLSWTVDNMQGENNTKERTKQHKDHKQQQLKSKQLTYKRLKVWVNWLFKEYNECDEQLIYVSKNSPPPFLLLRPHHLSMPS